jgi:hypothetical protein
MLLIKHRPGSRQPEQYALEPGLLQIPGQRRAKRSLLQSKVARRDYFDVGSDDHVSDVESACRPTGRKPPVLGRSHGGCPTSPPCYRTWCEWSRGSPR